MRNRVVSFIFFANYFVGLLAVALSVETVVQLGLPLNDFSYYLLLFLTTVFYYTFAYSVPETQPFSANPRTEWYRTHARFIRVSQSILLLVSASLTFWFLFKYFDKILVLRAYYWLLISAVGLAAILYYGLLPQSIIRLNLRRTGWLKAFVIGFVWAGCVNIFPITMLKLEKDIVIQEPVLVLWLFVKNWMFCTVNAIMFDIKDYDDDSNIELKTFAVRFGLRNTIFYVLIPLMLIGLVSFLALATFKGFGTVKIFFNLIPFLCLLPLAFSLQKPRNILYYLIVIDGMLLLKAVCGIAGSYFG